MPPLFPVLMLPHGVEPRYLVVSSLDRFIAITTTPLL